ncbi:molybdopterin-dependent oxidoreductase [candidate division KSB1 bacterium]|nr:molybdopterin-dependent oxidoreductase [candidate division KSB1 bacterium]
MPTKTLASACTLDCPDTCGLDVEITENKITRIAASDINPTTQGFICTKVSRFAERVYSPDRLLYPMKRVGEKGAGKFERISWNEAVKIVCQRFNEIKEEWGGEAILPYSYGGSNALLGQDTSDRAFFAKLGASRLARTVCAAPTSEAAQGMYGKMPGTAFEDYVHAKFILIWGANPKASNIHLVPYLKKAKAAGAKIAVVDPRLNFSEKEIDLHLPVYPGTDVVVALALIHHWQKMAWLNWDFLGEHTKNVDVLLEKAKKYPPEKAAEIAGVQADDIKKLAEMYALHDPAVLRCGWGLERNRNGGQSVAAVLALPAVLGKFGLQGSGYTLSNSNAHKVDSRGLTDPIPWNTRIINMNKLGKVLLEENQPPIKGLFNYNCNPVATVPNQKAIIAGLQREDLFTVVSEQVMTDTAKFADILLPAVTFLEQKEIKKAYGSYTLHYLDPVIEPLGEARPNEEVFALLGRSMGWQDQAFLDDTDAYLQRVTNSTHGMGKPVGLDHLKKEKIAFFDFPGRAPIQFQNVFPWTPDGKINLAPGNLGKNPYEYLDLKQNGYPLTLISPATDKLISSTLGEFNFPKLFLVMNPGDARARSLEKGVTARIFNDLGEVFAPVQMSKQIRPGVVLIPKGAWRKSSKNGLTSTTLVPDDVSSVGGGACFNDARVEVAAV